MLRVVLDSIFHRLKFKLAITEKTWICTYGHNHKEKWRGKTNSDKCDERGDNSITVEEEKGNYSDEEVEEDENFANDNVDNHYRDQSDCSTACADEDDSWQKPKK